MIYPTAADIKAICPRARASIIGPLADALPSVLEQEGINTPLRVAHFLAQCAVEAAGFDTYEEYASGAAYEGRKGLGNVRPGDGRRFKGRGPIQLTGRDNYRRATPYVRKVLGRDIDLEATPELVAQDKAVGLATSVWYWKTNDLNRWADNDDAPAVSRGVNRGNPRATKPANHEAERVAMTARFRGMLKQIQARMPAAPPVMVPVAPPAPVTPAPIPQPPPAPATAPANTAPKPSLWARLFGRKSNA